MSETIFKNGKKVKEEIKKRKEDAGKNAKEDAVIDKIIEDAKKRKEEAAKK